MGLKSGTKFHGVDQTPTFPRWKVLCNMEQFRKIYTSLRMYTKSTKRTNLKIYNLIIITVSKFITKNVTCIAVLNVDTRLKFKFFLF